MATVGIIAKQLKKRKQMLQELAGEEFGQMPIDVKSAQEQGVIKSAQAEKERKLQLKEREIAEGLAAQKERAKELAASKSNTSQQPQISKKKQPAGYPRPKDPDFPTQEETVAIKRWELKNRNK